jgi:hypothetical protein
MSRFHVVPGTAATEPAIERPRRVNVARGAARLERAEWLTVLAVLVVVGFLFR